MMSRIVPRIEKLEMVAENEAPPRPYKRIIVEPGESEAEVYLREYGEPLPPEGARDFSLWVIQLVDPDPKWALR